MTPRPVALVTGVGRTVGIAAAICRTLAIEGWDLVVSYWTPADHAVFGERAGPAASTGGYAVGPARWNTPPCSVQDLPTTVRFVAISHNQ